MTKWVRFHFLCAILLEVPSAIWKISIFGPSKTYQSDASHEGLDSVLYGPQGWHLEEDVLEEACRSRVGVRSGDGDISVGVQIGSVLLLQFLHHLQINYEIEKLRGEPRLLIYTLFFQFSPKLQYSPHLYFDHRVHHSCVDWNEDEPLSRGTLEDEGSGK